MNSTSSILCLFFLFGAVEDFLIHDLYELAAFAEQQPTSEKLNQVFFFHKNLIFHRYMLCFNKDTFTLNNYIMLCLGQQGITQVLSIIDTQHQPWLNGMELLDDALHNKHVLSTGCEGYAQPKH